MTLVRAGAAVAAVVALILAPAGNGAQRGGNHGCDPSTGTVFSDHFFPTGDRVIAGFYVEEENGFPRGSLDETIVVENIGPEGPSAFSCGADPGTWVLFKSALGPGKDKARLDAVGLQQKYIVPPEPLPKSIDSLLSGGGGRDRLRGHVGFDKIRGGAGGDVIKAADGGKPDTIRCGPGNDKAVVDPNDDVAKCERVVVR